MTTNTSIELDQNTAQAEAQIAGLARLGMLINHQNATEYPDQLERHIEEREQLERENALSIEVERTVKIVLCTGGPHCEIRWPENRTPSIVCYGWFGADRFERDLTDDEVAGIEYAYGDWDEIIRMANEADLDR